MSAERRLCVGIVPDRVGGVWDSPSTQLRLYYPWLGLPWINVVAVDSEMDTGELHALGLDILIFTRLSHGSDPGRSLLAAAKNIGLPCVWDVDDDFSAVAKDTDHEESTSARNLAEQMRSSVHDFDLVWASTETLAARIEALGVGVRVRPTLPPAQLSREPIRPVGPRRPSLLYFGTTTHFRDWDVVRGVLKSHATQGRLSVTVVGATEAVTTWSGLRHFRGNGNVYSRYLAYMDWLGRLGSYDVGIAPLARTAVNEAKSALKVLEYGSMGMLPLASDMAPYSILRTLGLQECLMDSASDWDLALQELEGLEIHDLFDRRLHIQMQITSYVADERERMLMQDLKDFRAISVVGPDQG